LDAVFSESRGCSVDFTDLEAPNGSLAWPTSPFGQLLAEAFDRGMEPSDWGLIDLPDARARRALLNVWTAEVVPALAQRFEVSVTLGW
jgi:hypothetical protein